MRKSARHSTRPGVARPLRLYLMLGAWSIGASGSMMPLALASSAALMLTFPLVNHLWRSRRR